MARSWRAFTVMAWAMWWSMARRTVGGFTLLEIMVALAVFATLAAAVFSASHAVIGQGRGVEQRLFAAWLADNRLNELRLEKNLALGQHTRQVSLDRRDWHVQQHLSATADRRLLKVEVAVSLVGQEHVVYRTTGWIPAP